MNKYKLALLGFAVFAALFMVAIIATDYANKKVWWTIWDIVSYVSLPAAFGCFYYAWKKQPEK